MKHKEREIFMKHTETATELKARVKKRRMCGMIISAVFLLILIVFNILYGQSKVVEEISIGPIKHDSVTYNEDFMWGILIGAFGLIYSVIFLIADFIFSQVVAFEINGDHITFYRGCIHTDLYVNGEKCDSLSLGFRNCMEATLSDGTKVNVSLGKYSARFIFSNGHPSMDISVMNKG